MNGLFGKLYGFYLIEKIKDSFKSEEGQTLVEYALILVLCIVVILAPEPTQGNTANRSAARS
jgi:hypothetical protein